LAPRVQQSGKKIRIGGVSGPGNKRVQYLMVQCAHSACRFDPRLRGFYERYSKRRGSKKTVVAVAHEMIRIVFYMLKRVEAYQGERREVTERKLKSLERRALNGLRN